MTLTKASGFCFSFNQMLKKGRLLYQGSDEVKYWKNIQNSIRTSKKLALKPQFTNLVNAYLMEEPTYGVFEIKNAYILSYRWPQNGEYRDFLLTDDMFIVESPKHKEWYSSYPFIKVVDGTIYFDLSSASPKQINETIAWLPHSDNYTHFHLDFFGPWCEYLEQGGSLTGGSICVRNNAIKSWQKELLESLTPSQYLYRPMKMGQINLWRVKKVIVPISPSLCRTIENTRSYYINLFKQNDSNYTFESISILYLKRSSNEAKRVSNSQEIENFVKDSGGLSIDISALSYKQKIDILSRANIIIVEGSGVSNALIFCDKKTQVLILSAEETRKDISFALGGWLYSSALGDRLTIIPSVGDKITNNSPLGCYSYPVESIKKAIKNITN